MKLIKIIFQLLLTFNVLNSYSQVDQEKDKEVENTNSNSLKISKKAKKIVSSLESENEVETAKNYEEVGNTFVSKNETKKAELYLKKALDIYTKLKMKEDISRVSRTLGKLSEKLEDKKSAINFYQNSINNDDEKQLNTLNSIDIQRLDQKSEVEELDKIDEKINLLDKVNDAEELKDGYIQQGEVNEKLRKFQSAIDSYKKAYNLDKTTSNEKIELNAKISKLFVENKKYDHAIELLNKQLKDAKQKNQRELEYHIHCELADIYFSNGNNNEAIGNLKSAFQIAINQGNTKLVKQAVERLIQFYKKHHMNNEQIALYDNFIDHFEELIKSDSSLIDENTFNLIENKIIQLEKEKQLKDKLIAKTNWFNTILMISILALLVLILLILKYSSSVRKKNKQIALQSLRREMNPHFVFNSLNSVNQYIAQNNELKANRFLTSYSNLMRTIMENSTADFIQLSTELELIEKYVSLEHQRFSDKFDYEINIDKNLDIDAILIPNMIIQPYIENAVWHGLRYLDKAGKLIISFVKKDQTILITIDDSGIGISKSLLMKTKNQHTHNSLGLKNIHERIKLLNDLYKLKIKHQTLEKNTNDTGTLVEIVIPLTFKSNFNV